MVVHVLSQYERAECRKFQLRKQKYVYELFAFQMLIYFNFKEASAGEVICGDCKTTNKVGYKFCRKCGQKGPLPGAAVASSSGGEGVTSPRQVSSPRAPSSPLSASSPRHSASASSPRQSASSPRQSSAPAATVTDEVACPACSTSNKVIIF
jgi:hypothetical protein